MDHFQGLEDPRIERSKRHQLLDIVATICAVICGADSWVYVEMFGKSKEEWFRTSGLAPRHSLPRGDVFSRLDPEQFQRCFMEWTQAVAALMPGEVVAIAARRCAAPTTRLWANRPSTWSALGLGQYPDLGAGEDGEK